MSEASCLCCGHVGTPKVSLIDKPEVYVCERCHRRATLPMPEHGFSTEAEGDAYTHGWFDGNEAPRAAGVDASASADPGMSDLLRMSRYEADRTLSTFAGYIRAGNTNEAGEMATKIMRCLTGNPGPIGAERLAGIAGPALPAHSLDGLADWLRTQAKHPCAGEVNGKQWTAWATAVDAACGVQACASTFTTEELDAFYDEWEFAENDPGRIEFHNLIREAERRIAYRAAGVAPVEGKSND
jgi:hypothetical protein